MMDEPWKLEYPKQVGIDNLEDGVWVVLQGKNHHTKTRGAASVGFLKACLCPFSHL